MVLSIHNCFDNLGYQDFCVAVPLLLQNISKHFNGFEILESMVLAVFNSIEQSSRSLCFKDKTYVASSSFN